MPKEITPLDIALDTVASLQELQEKLPRQTARYYIVGGMAAELKSLTAELDAEQPKRKRAA